MKKITTLLLIMLILIGLSACAAQDANADEPDTQPEPKDEEPVAGQSIFISDAGLLVMESYPVQVNLFVKGDKSTPCHELQIEFEETDKEFEIHVSLSAVQNTDEGCIEVLEPFEESISLPVKGLPDGIYKVFLNGEEVGEFSYPG